MDTPKWSSLRSLGTSRLLRTSYLWFILVPILAKVVIKIESYGGFKIGDYKLDFNLSLPFSWELFFYAAVFASFANLIYLWKCPDIIKHFPTYSDFKERGKEGEQLRKEFEKLLTKYGKKIRGSDLQKNVKEYLSSFCELSSSERDSNGNLTVNTDEIPQNSWLAARIVSSHEIETGKVADAFWFVRDFADDLNKGYGRLCFLFYAIALILVLFVSIQNIWSVIVYSINTHIGG